MVQEHDGIAALPPDEWDALMGPDRLTAKHAFLSAVQDSGLNDCRYHVLTARREGRLVAGMAAFSITLDLALFAQGPVTRLIGAVRKLFPRFLMLPEMECGSPVALGQTFACAPGEDPAAVLPLLVQRLEAIARRRGIGLMVLRDFEPGDGRWALGQGYTELPNLPDTRLPVRWPDLAGYEQAMRSEYRNRLRRRLRHSAQAGLAPRLVRSYGHLAPQLLDLWMQTFQEAREYRREVLTEAFFVETDRRLGDRSRVLLLEREGTPVAFALLLQDDATLRWLFAGMARSVARDGHYHTLVAEILRHGMEIGAREIELGITTYPPKMDAGADPQPLRLFMKHLSPPLRRLVPRVFGLLSSTPEPRPRQVFRR